MSTLSPTKSVKLIPTQVQNKTYMDRQTSDTQIFKEFVPSILPLFKKKIKKNNAHKARTHWYCQPFGQIYKYQIQEKILFKKEWRETITTN